MGERGKRGLKERVEREKERKERYLYIMVNKTVVLDVVGLTRELISRGHTPFLAEYLERASSADVEPAFPALTCTAQVRIMILFLVFFGRKKKIIFIK